jgi:hypothetical protein
MVPGLADTDLLRLEDVGLVGAVLPRPKRAAMTRLRLRYATSAVGTSAARRAGGGSCR